MFAVVRSMCTTIYPYDYYYYYFFSYIRILYVCYAIFVLIFVCVVVDNFVAFTSHFQFRIRNVSVIAAIVPLPFTMQTNMLVDHTSNIHTHTLKNTLVQHSVYFHTEEQMKFD